MDNALDAVQDPGSPGGRARWGESLRSATRVDRRPGLTEQQLREEYVIPGLPVVISQFGNTWPARERWLPFQALAARVGEANVPLLHLPPAGTNYYPDVQPVETSFGSALEKIFSASDQRYYLSQVALVELAPALAEDFHFPRPVPEATTEPAFFWIGTGGCVSRLHFDLAHNFACQVSGRKLFRLYPPSETHRLYASVASKFSPVSTLGDTPLDQFPLFQRAAFIEVELTPGDLLFLPSFWWHQVITDEPGIMVTCFWNTPEMTRDRQRLGPWSMAVASQRVDRALAQIGEFETQTYRDVLLAAISREAQRAGALDLALQALRRITNGQYAEKMAELFEHPRAQDGGAFTQ